MRIATLNVQNMRLRGDHLDGARDGDTPGDTGPMAEALDVLDRRLTAALIRDAEADLLVLQEVFDAETLEHFHRRHLVPSGVHYPHRTCLPGNDGRGLDLAVLARLRPIRIRSHAGLTAAQAGIDPALGLAPDEPVFRRDCLEIELDDLTLFACHFKAPYPDPDVAWSTRRAEALAVRHLIETRFADPVTARWLVLGDLNDPRDAPESRHRAIAPLLPPFSESLVDRLPDAERWSYHQPQARLYAAPDKLLASPALAAANAAARPIILRQGLGFETSRYTGPRLAGTGHHRPHASDHALIYVDLD
ncbi:endonuclease/exonuclease/phosphatase family protein [Marimonas arenosa]|uniref:Endonuclease/exonuclease/phosphatase family protein n=1 Tax=Marimonas arenosa TaxID=1795305 RepID=A0AAE3WDF0_9RHOB|nr:endonuclease/exonuclease/phosphatase family protein [Marimonas arenosa]MDQ2089578.1 endonuclease/exonuclease/phosphatase family protein [Marimonas arenosa]